MQGIFRVKWLAAIAALLSSAGMAQAQETALDATPAFRYVQFSQPFMLAANETGVVLNKEEKTSAAPVPASSFEPPLLTGSNAHLVLGLSTIAAAGLAAVTAPDGDGAVTGAPRDVNGTHAKLAKASVALAAATIVSGLISHWDDFSLEDGFTDPDNLHILLGVTGAALMAYAVDRSAKSSVPISHATEAELGALGMLVAIKLTW